MDISKDPERIKWDFWELVKNIVTLSSTSEKQKEIMGYGWVAEEMAVDFETYYCGNTQKFLDSGLLTKNQVSMLNLLDNFLEARSGDKMPEFWNDNLLASHHDWATVRVMAKDILTDMGYNNLTIEIERTNKRSISDKGKPLLIESTKTFLWNTGAISSSNQSLNSPDALKETLFKILTNTQNANVLAFLEIDVTSTEISITPRHEITGFTHEGLENFWSIDIPDSTKYLLAMHGIMIQPDTGEIFAFQFGRSEVAFKMRRGDKSLGSLPKLKGTFMTNLTFKNYQKLSLVYFSNLKGDDIIDARSLGENWALSIFFTGETPAKIKEFYSSIAP